VKIVANGSVLTCGTAYESTTQHNGIGNHRNLDRPGAILHGTDSFALAPEQITEAEETVKPRTDAGNSGGCGLSSTGAVESGWSK
jgi:hypothetical protein